MFFAVRQLVPDADKEKASDECDARLAEAIEIVLEAGQASVSMLQRRMRVGYARAGRLIDEMAARGLVSQSEGSKSREVLITREQYIELFIPWFQIVQYSKSSKEYTFGHTDNIVYLCTTEAYDILMQDS